MSDWKCPRCDMLLGKDVDIDGTDWLEVRYKNVKYRVIGLIVATCRRCGAESDRESLHSSSCQCIECDHDREAQTKMEKPE